MFLGLRGHRSYIGEESQSRKCIRDSKKVYSEFTKAQSKGMLILETFRKNDIKKKITLTRDIFEKDKLRCSRESYV